MLRTPKITVAPALGRRVGLDRRLIVRLATRVRRAASRLHIDDEQLASLGLRIVDDAEMTRLHLEFMGEQGPTDVLSFSPEGVDELDARPLGDIVLDWDAVERQARDRSAAALLDEATVLIVHGLAHLHGHDHRDLREGRAMHRFERRVLRGLQVGDPPRPYAPRLRARELAHD